MDYDFRGIEAKQRDRWKEKKVYEVKNSDPRPSFYVLDMFPYPSGAGLHVGHPLGYIASDIFSRYKRLQGFNVLHPMGFDSFGLPAEQYALDTGQHPAVTTEKNIETFKSQLDKIGFCFDWSREVKTSDPNYYKWTQWIFLQLFNSYFCGTDKKAKPIELLEKQFGEEGLSEDGASAKCIRAFTASEWNDLTEKERQDTLMNFRLAFSSYGEVNWCEGLGTVLANDEVVNGVSERGGFPVVKKKMRQWYLRITSYADRLLESLNHLDFSDAMKEMQRNWIGKSEGAELAFDIEGNDAKIRVYTTRPDTIFGVDFLVLAPEHDLVKAITSAEQRTEVEKYLDYTKTRSDRERQAEVKQITGCFTGAYAKHPFSDQKIPIWIAEYVLAGYGTGAIMAVPCGDQRDFDFAKHFDIPITNIIGDAFNDTEANPTKEATLQHSDFLNGMMMKDAIGVAINKIEEKGIGRKKVNFRMRDAGFSRQRYWGEPFPIVWNGDTAVPMISEDLPLELPKVASYKPGPEGQGPLANLEDWVADDPRGVRETSTMPGYAGSSWYFLRYMDPNNEDTFCDRKASDYWGQVDVYVGGTEHAVGHLLYSRMWTKVLYDLGLIGFDEPFKKLVNQGMIQGSSRFVHRLHGTNTFVSAGLLHTKDFKDKTDKIHVDVNFVDGLDLDIEAFKKFKGGEFADADFILQDGKYICSVETEKMSKSKWNTVNPNDLVDTYGADTFRMYEMFLGPVEQSKPWDTKGIEGVHRFLKKLWRLFFDELKGKVWNEDAPTNDELKVLHKTIKKIQQNTESFSFNTAVSAFMICVNELHDLKCYKKDILQPLLILLTPYAPHIAEELWQQTNGEGFILDAAYPKAEEKYLIEAEKEYPVSINGKLRSSILLSTDVTSADAEKAVLAKEEIVQRLEGKPVKKFIFVKDRMINLVV